MRSISDLVYGDMSASVMGDDSARKPNCLEPVCLRASNLALHHENEGQLIVFVVSEKHNSRRRARDGRKGIIT